MVRAEKALGGEGGLASISAHLSVNYFASRCISPLLRTSLIPAGNSRGKASAKDLPDPPPLVQLICFAGPPAARPRGGRSGGERCTACSPPRPPGCTAPCGPRSPSRRPPSPPGRPPGPSAGVPVFCFVCWRGRWCDGQRREVRDWVLSWTALNSAPFPVSQPAAQSVQQPAPASRPRRPQQ